MNGEKQLPTPDAQEVKTETIDSMPREVGQPVSWQEIESTFSPKQVEGLRRLVKYGVAAFGRGRSAEAFSVNARNRNLRPAR